MITEDTRQQTGKHDHIERWMGAHGVDFRPRALALPFGDYVSDNGSNVAVDTKKGVQELAMDLGRDHDRFVRECERARDAGYRLVVLVESSARYNSRLELERWVSEVCHRCRMCDPRFQSRCKAHRYKPMQGRTLARICETMSARYGVAFEFVSKARCARRICELLGEVYED